MTILKSICKSYKALKTLIFVPNPYEAVEHLSDDQLKDIGMYREGGVIYSFIHTPELDKAQPQRADEVIFIPKALQERGG